MTLRTNPFTALVFAAAAAIALPDAGTAQQEGHAPAATARAPFVFETGDVALEDLIDRCASYLKRNILVPAAEVQAAQGRSNRKRPQQAAAADGAEASGPFVSLQLPVVTDANGCEELLTSILWSYGLALVPIDEAKGVYEVLALNGQRGREISQRAVQRTPEQVLARPTLRQFVSVVYTLQHTNAVIATNALRPFFSTSSSNQPALLLGNVGNATSLLVTGPQDMVANAIRRLQVADVPQPPESSPFLDQRLEALAQRLEALEKRLAALEPKPATGNR